MYCANICKYKLELKWDSTLIAYALTLWVVTSNPMVTALNYKPYYILVFGLKHNSSFGVLEIIIHIISRYSSKIRILQAVNFF